jgi:hypothetical protein
VANETYWPLQKRVDDLLHTLVTIHRKVRNQPSPQFHAYKGRNEQFDWLEHPSITRHKNRMPMQIEDIGTLRARNLVKLVGDRRDEKTFEITDAGFEFHDEHCTRESH